MRDTIQGLIADIGGTNARFALVNAAANITNEIILKCDSYSSINEAISAYLQQVDLKSAPKRASLAIAGPVKGDQINMTNHPWSFSIKALKDEFGFEKLTVMNDFEAVAFAIPFLEDKYLEKIGGGAAVELENKAVIGPGTGLGAALLIAKKDKSGFQVVPGEGGHVTMPARNQREFDIIHYLEHHKYSHVSGERVCSGKGLLNLYDTIRVLDDKMDRPALTPEQITKKAMDKSCEICVECLALMVRFLGRLASNMALMVNAYGGVYIAGGIAPQLIDYIKASDFRAEYWSKGRYKEYMRAIPTYIVTHPYVAFEGLRQDVLS
ncbi:MAG: glucokinase [Micavibrio sp.]|nr:glucokinase [Micavibrio sp.]|tara:strand:+ start:715 stop:1683 length:969 start_codon:yes stop_codon:yes gene_type:complete